MPKDGLDQSGEFILELLEGKFGLEVREFKYMCLELI